MSQRRNSCWWSCVINESNYPSLSRIDKVQGCRWSHIPNKWALFQRVSDLRHIKWLNIVRWEVFTSSKTKFLYTLIPFLIGLSVCTIFGATQSLKLCLYTLELSKNFLFTYKLKYHYILTCLKTCYS